MTQPKQTKRAPRGPQPSPSAPKQKTSSQAPRDPSPPAASPASRSATLAVLRDGEPIDDDAARELWDLFSRHMDDASASAEGRFDAFAAMDSFAAELGFVSARPSHERGRAVLRLSSAASAPRPQRSSR
jgi:hypothetical protein